MKRESIVFAVTGILFGLMVGWIIGSQQAATGVARQPAPAQATPTTQASTPAPSSSGGSGSAPAVLDETRVRALTSAAEQRPQDAAVRVELGNVYFDAERFQDAVTWYEQALTIDARNVNASTDLGVAYYYLGQPDRAIAQFERSLAVDPKHAKTLLNMGIVRAFGKQDLDGAAKAWEQVISLSPDSPEGRAARQALEGMRSAHPETGGSASTSGKPSP
jgi:tetratricopeptide (TPR) repeat protein